MPSLCSQAPGATIDDVLDDGEFYSMGKMVRQASMMGASVEEVHMPTQVVLLRAKATEEAEAEVPVHFPRMR